MPQLVQVIIFHLNCLFSCAFSVLTVISAENSLSSFPSVMF